MPQPLDTEPETSPNTLTVQSYSSAEPFLARMEPLLLAHEAKYGLMLGIALTIIRQPDFYGDKPPLLLLAEDGDGIAAAALMTPPHGLVVYSERVDALPGLRAIAQELNDAGWSLPTVNGPEPVCTEFAQIWAEGTGLKSEVAVSERVFELREVIHPRYSPGHLRVATGDDLELVTQWFVDFVEEAMHGIDTTTHDETRKRVQMRIEQGMIYLWDDGKRVSVAGTTRATATGISMGRVYTPRQLRGRGYASSCVAAASQRLLDDGRAFCTLFTDLANPTSNSIYQKIGYRPVCDYTVYRFVPRAE